MLTWLSNKYNEFVDYLWALMLSLFDMLKDFFYWSMEQLLLVCTSLLDGLGSLLSGLDFAQYFSGIPPETAYMLKICGFSEAMGMIITCLGIRFILQLIPFVRWGS